MGRRKYSGRISLLAKREMGSARASPRMAAAALRNERALSFWFAEERLCVWRMKVADNLIAHQSLSYMLAAAETP